LSNEKPLISVSIFENSYLFSPLV